MTDRTAKDIFVTGFPGYLATKLLARLVVDRPGQVFHLLVLPGFMEHAEATLGELNRNVPGVLQRCRLHAGDITAARLGLTSRQWRELTGSVGEVYHLAAVYDLGVAKPLAYAVNVEGTRNVLALAEAAKGSRLVYFSTCYVAGDRSDLILEDELQMGQGFRNYYEETKYHAEVEVRSRVDLPVVIIRPSIVAGDSKTGAIPKFDGPYFIIQLLARLEKRGLLPPFLVLPRLGRSRAKVNLVPVDFLVDAVTAIVDSPRSTGATFHLADPAPLPVWRLYELIMQAFGIRLAGWLPGAVLEASAAIPHLDRILGFPRQLLSYFNHLGEFDTANVTSILAGKGITCPSVESYLQLMIDFTRSQV
ncbi:SDR family oxidoreductase [bacterium]|nr:SDR family oxidoreductase [candidate division CSSED10-310 bacterium]